jgi:dipeptidyl aminopeptidase/acylaminoacyl peptidase
VIIDNKSRLITLVLLVCVSWGITAPPRAGAQAREPLSVEDALRTVEFGELMPVGLSPDGKWLAYTVKSNQRTRTIDRETWARYGVRDVFTGMDIWVLNVGTGVSKDLTSSEYDNFMPVWSTDGHYLAFLSDRDGSGQLRLWIWDVTRDQLKKVSDLSVRQFGQIEWIPHSQKIIVPVVPENLSLEEYVKKVGSAAEGEIVKPSSKVPGSTILLYQSSGSAAGKQTPSSDPWNLDRHLRDLAVIDLASGTATTLVRGEKIASFFVSPDGSRIAYTVPKRFEKPGSQQILFDLVTKTLGTDEERVVASDVRFEYNGGSFSWSPDGMHLAYRTGGPEEKIRDCFLVDVDGGKVRNISALSSLPPHTSTAPLWDLGNKDIYFIHNEALWRSSIDRSAAVELAHVPDRQIVKMIAQSDNLLWTPDGGKSAIAVTQDEVGKQNGFYKIDLETGESAKLLEKGQCYTCLNSDHPFTVESDGRAVVFFAEDAQHDNDLWISDSNFRSPRRLTHLNSQFDKYKMGSARLVDWLSDDGQPLRGALLLPADYQEGKRYPLIVWVYGGSSRSNDFDRFGLVGSGPFNMQLFATRGYAILAPDSPQQLGTPMADVAKTVLPGVNRVIDMGIADPNRVGVMGHSNGGYSTLSLIVQTKRFNAALEADGMADLISHYGEMDRTGAAFGTSNLEHGQDALGGTPWEVRDRYVENSPIFYLDRVETPLLIVQASKDTAVAPFQGDEAFVDLRRLGKEVQYAKYEGEQHSPIYWSYANQADLCDRMIAWFDRYLKGLDR